MTEVVTTIIEEGVRGVGLAVLKLVTLGRYRLGSGEPQRLVEGAVGLVVIAAVLAAIYYW